MAADNLTALLAHVDWLRDLARKLVGGTAADDAVQDTYVAALPAPPDPDLPAQPWLARVLRNASRMAQRSSPRRARRADADQRRELAAHIAAAQAARKTARPAHHSALGSAESADQGSFGSGHEGQMDKDVIRGAMREVIPYLADCYSEARGTTLSADHLEIRASFTLTGDPDIGTVIDAKQLVDDSKHALPTKLDDCLSEKLQTLELPPLGDGDTIDVYYPLVFADGPADGSGSGSSRRAHTLIASSSFSVFTGF